MVDVDKTIEKFNSLMDDMKKVYEFTDILSKEAECVIDLENQREVEIDALNKKYDGLVNEHVSKVSQMKDEFHELSVPIAAGFDKIDGIIEVLSGRNEKVVHRLSKDDVLAACDSRCKIHMFDEMYDDNAVSLRAVIVSESTWWERIRNKGHYELYVFGYARNEVVDEFGNDRLQGLNDYFMVTENGMGRTIVAPYVCLRMRTWSNVKVLKRYYEREIKSLNGKGHNVNSLNKLLAVERRREYDNEELRKECSLEDFRPILGFICPDCGKDGYSRSHMKCNEVCIHCNAWLVKNEVFVNE